jgi:hypothetical protein
MPSNGLPFSRCLAALANATGLGAERDSKTQKSSDLVRRKTVGWNTVLGGWVRRVVSGVLAGRVLVGAGCALENRLCDRQVGASPIVADRP